MKLLFLTEFFPRDSKLIFTGGVEVRTYYIVKQARKDFQLEVISSRSSKVPATPISVFTRAYFLFSAFFKALTKQFDLIESSNVVSYLPAYLAGRLKGKRTLAWIADVLGRHWFQFGLAVGLPGFLLEKISLRLNWDGIIALSQVTKEKLIKAGIDSSKIKVIHGGINLKEFIGPQFKKFPRFTIICIARLVATKRVNDLIQALAFVASQQPQVRLIIIGHGPKQAELFRLTQKLKLDKKIRFLSRLPRTDLIKLLKQSHLFCLPSVVEGFGLVTIEAMAAGLPAVLADIPVNRETCQQNQGAVFYRPQDSADLAQKIIKLMTDKVLYRQKQTQTAGLARKYRWSRIYQQTKAVYNQQL